jgi:Domain of unknown function (DUF3850)
MIIDHELKILPCYFKAASLGDKCFEIRDNTDRGFQKGDIVKLREYEPGVVAGHYTGLAFNIEITYVTNAYQKDGYVVFGFKKIREGKEHEAETKSDRDQEKA